MKTKNANLGLGDARGRSRRNKRVKQVTKANWGAQRVEFFKKNVRFAAAAKATRTAMEVTQQEVAVTYGVSQGTVCNWESGKYSWPGGETELFEYFQTINLIARS
ncbi:MAG: hypothetical protein ACWGQW_02720 [bacterium]